MGKSKVCTYGAYALLPEAEGVSPVKERKRGTSWLKVVGIVLAVLLALASVFALGSYLWARHIVREITVKDPVSLPIHALPEDELEIIKDRAKLFYDLLKAGKTAEVDDFVVTQDEVNGFMAHSDYLRGNAYLHINESLVSLDMSLPAKFLPGGRGRYFVASGFVKTEPKDDKTTLVTAKLDTLKPIEGLTGPLFFAEMLGYMSSNGEYNLNLQSGRVADWIVPQDYIDEKENLLEDLYECDHMAPIAKAIQSISIEEQKITFHVRRDDGDEQQSEESETAAATKSNTSKGGARRLLSWARLVI